MWGSEGAYHEMNQELRVFPLSPQVLCHALSIQLMEEQRKEEREETK